MPIPDFIVGLREKIGHELLWLPGVTSVVLRENEVLLVRRADTGAWAPVTGIVDPGEHPARTATREVAEETGVSCEIEALVWVNVTGPLVHVNGDRAQYLDHTFRCRYLGGVAHVADDESSEVGWFPVGRLPEMETVFEDRILAAVGHAGPVRLDRTASEATPLRREHAQGGSGLAPGGLHHIELWVPDLQTAAAEWGWLLHELGYLDYQRWPTGRSWRLGSTYLVIEQSPDQTDQTHDRHRPGVNHLAFHAGDPERVDTLALEARSHGWQTMFPQRYPHAGGSEHYAAYLHNSHGYEVELVAVPGDRWPTGLETP
jgi:ADP-ribose pyrophosphatase YjhB (NUDIX family)